MSSLEDQVRAALRAEGELRRPIQPLRLPSADTRPGLRARLAGSGHRARLAGGLGGWLVPALAGAVVVLIAISLVTIKAIDKGTAVSRAIPTPAASGLPRYYVSLSGITDVNDATTLVVGDARTGARLATIPAPKGAVFVGTTPAAAGDDRTFIVAEASQEPRSHPPVATTSPLGWYQLQITPGARSPVQMTRLPIQATVADGVVGGTGQGGDMALSADGTRLAVFFTRNVPGKGQPSAAATQQVLRVYSVSTGQLLHAWYGTTRTSSNDRLATDLSWAGGDSTVAFAVAWDMNSHTEMHTLDVTAGGADLLADSHVVWSQYVPVPPGELYTRTTPYPCTSPFLAPSGRAVVCTYPDYPPGGPHHALAWVEYQLSRPGTPLLLGSVPVPPGKDSTAYGYVEWVSPAGSEVIGMWTTMTVGPFKNHSASFAMKTGAGVISGGAVRPLDTGTYQLSGDEAW